MTRDGEEYGEAAGETIEFIESSAPNQPALLPAGMSALRRLAPQTQTAHKVALSFDKELTQTAGRSGRD